MIQINNGFQDHYYLTEDCIVYDAKRKTNLKKYHHTYKLKTINGQYKSISERELYRLCYHKVFCLDNIQSLPDEIWKEIPETNGIYFVSNKGRIKSYADYEARILKPIANKKSGYYRVDILYGSGRQAKLISRLVAAAFLEAPNSIDDQLHHIDNNKNNNAADNLIWLSPAEHRKIHQEKRNTND